MSPVIEGDMALVTGDRPTRLSAAAHRSGEGARRRHPARPHGARLRGRGVCDARRSPAVAATGPPDAAADARRRSSSSTLLTSPQSVVITEKLARRRGYALGDEIRLMTGDRVGTYVDSRAARRTPGPARVMDGSFVLMDIAAAQLAFARLGRIDRVDVQIVREPTAPRCVADADQRRPRRRPSPPSPPGCPPGSRPAGPPRRGQQVEQMLAAFHLNLSALSWVALVVGLFLVYNTATMTVLARREEVGMLRALGVTRRQVLRSVPRRSRAARRRRARAIGVGLGRLLADWAVGITGATVSTLYIATAAAPPALDAGHVVLAVRHRPAAVAAGRGAAGARGVAGAAHGRHARQRPARIARPAAACARSWCRCARAGRRVRAGAARAGGRPSALRLRLGLCDHHRRGAAGAGAALRHWRALVRQPLRRLLGVEGLLAHAHLAAAIPRLSISVAALSVSLAMMVAIAVMIGSFRDTVVYWVGQTLQADLFVGPGVQPTVGSAQTLSAGGDRRRAPRIPTSRPSTRSATSTSSTRATWSCSAPASSTSCCRTARCSSRRRPTAARRCAAAHRQRRGRRVRGVRQPLRHRAWATRCSWPRRPASGRSASRASTTTTPWTAASIVMDRGTFAKHFGDLPPTSVAVYLRDGADPGAGAPADPRRPRRRPPRLHLHQPRAARRGAAHLRQHVRHHLRARAHRHRGGDAGRGRHAADAGARAAARAAACCGSSAPDAARCSG